MTFRKISLPFLIFILGAACAHGKKAPKFEQAHQFTPEQAALVERAIGREGADKEHQAAHAFGGDLNPEHQARREAL